MHKFLFILFFAIVLSACSTQPKVQYIYSNPNISDENKNTQWLIDRGECTQQSHRVPLPIRTPCLGSGFSKGYCEGSQSGLMAEAQSAREQIFDGCMAKRGYTKEVKRIE